MMVPSGWLAIDALSGIARHTALGAVAPGAYGTLHLSIGAVAKHAANPLFEQDKAWEPRLDNGYPNIVHSPSDPNGAWRLWYGTCGEVHNCHKQYFLHANSSDGIAWEKPNLARFAWNGSTANNIVMAGGGLGLYRDEHEADAAKRFKISGGSPAGCYSDDGASNCVVGVAASPDGIGNWTDVAALNFAKPWRPDCHTNLFYDPAPISAEPAVQRGAYIMTTRDFTAASGRDVAIAFSGAGAAPPAYLNWTEMYAGEYPPSAALQRCSKFLPSAWGGAGKSAANDTRAAHVDAPYDEDPYDKCGEACRAAPGCAYFWAYGSGKDAGVCCLKSAVLPGALQKPACTTCGGRFYGMDDPAPPTPTPNRSSASFHWYADNPPKIVANGTRAQQLYVDQF